MSNTLKIIVGIVVLIPIILVMIIATMGGKIVTEAVNRYGPDLLGVGIELEDVSFSLLSGEIQLQGLTIRNPEGYSSDHALKLDNVRIALKPLSIFSDQIEILDIVIEAPDVILELGEGGNNLRVIEANALAGAELAEESVTVIIDDLWVRNASFTLAGLPAGLSTPEIKLPDIHLEDIGAEGEGVPLSETVAVILSTVTATAMNAVGDANIEGLAGDIIEGGSDLIEDVGSAIKKGLGSLFGGGKDDEGDEEQDDGGN